MTTAENKAAPSRLVLAVGGVVNVGGTVVASAISIYLLLLATSRLHPIFVIPLVGACIISAVIIPTLAYGHIAAVVRGKMPGA